MVELIATVSSIEQARQLLEVGVDMLYFGEDDFGLRLPTSFTREEQRILTALAHDYGATVSVAVNAIFHNEGIAKVPEYLDFLKAIDVDTITVGDPGVVQIMKQPERFIPYRYDAQVMVTNSRQVNFWAKRGAVGAVMARELPQETLRQIASQVTVPIEVLVYGATCIHHSKRPLLDNYFNYIEHADDVTKERGFFLSEPMKPDTHYSIYQDTNGTHVFATDDVLLMAELGELYDMGVSQWKLEGLFADEATFVAIATCFVAARNAIELGQWTEALVAELTQQMRVLHPAHRGLTAGFYAFDPAMVK